MTTMLEKLTDAIDAELGKQEMLLADPLTLRRMMAGRAARAALQAIREPDDAMLRAGIAEGWCDAEMAQITHRAMIDAILAEDKA